MARVALSDVTAKGVERAIKELDQLGREAFLASFGLGRARGYFLIRGGRRYDSKAVVGAAHGYDRPDLGPLRPLDFTGGDATVARRLECPGFVVERLPRNPPWAQEELILALDVYLHSGLLDDTAPAVVELSRGGRRDTEVWDQSAAGEDGLVAAAVAIREGHAPPTAGPAEPERPHVAVSEVEAQHVEQFQVAVSAQVTVAARREQGLVLAFAHHLESRGRSGRSLHNDISKMVLPGADSGPPKKVRTDLVA